MTTATTPETIAAQIAVNRFGLCPDLSARTLCLEAAIECADESTEGALGCERIGDILRSALRRGCELYPAWTLCEDGREDSRFVELFCDHVYYGDYACGEED